MAFTFVKSLSVKTKAGSREKTVGWYVKRHMS